MGSAQGNDSAMVPPVVRIADLERHRDELIYEKKRLDDLLYRTETLLASARHGIYGPDPSATQHESNGHGSARPADSADIASTSASPTMAGLVKRRPNPAVKAESNESGSRSGLGRGDTSSSERDELESPPPIHKEAVKPSQVEGLPAAPRRNSFEQRMASLPVLAALPLKRASPSGSDANVDSLASAAASPKKATAWGIDARSPAARSRPGTEAMDEDDDQWNWDNLYGKANLEKAGDWRGFARPVEDKHRSQTSHNSHAQRQTQVTSTSRT